MRLWSFHPKYLDQKGLGGLWRECCQAQTVLTRKKGYYNHSGLQRFKQFKNPLEIVGAYMTCVHLDSVRRGYKFNFGLIKVPLMITNIIPVSRGQLEYEWQFYLSKIKVRSPDLHKTLCSIEPQLHPIFMIVDGSVESWERIKNV